MIVAPVSRNLGTKDKARAAAFYRDVLGFTINGNTFVNGPARLEFDEHDFAPNDWDHPQPPGSAAVYFEVSDLPVTREEVIARGGRPSAIFMLNWVKLRVFHLEDPDGHMLHFGQTYQEPDLAKPPPMIEKALPWLPVNDVASGVKHYCDVLGFRINYVQDHLGVLDRDDVTLLLIQRTPRHTGIGSASFYIHDADELYAEMLAKGARIKSPPVSYIWGLRTFEVTDPEGNELSFAQPFE